MKPSCIEVGDQIRRLLIVRPVGNRLWLCRCDCLQEVVRSEDELRTARSCGCVRLMTFDIATKTGWTVWDLARSEQSMKTGYVDCSVKDDEELENDEKRAKKRDALLSAVPSLFRKFWPDFVVIEQPLNNVKAFPKKPKKDLLSGIGGAPKTGKPDMGMNPNSAFTAQQMFAVVDAVAHAYVRQNRHEVHPQTWQVILSPYRHLKDTKARSIEACRVRGIPLPPQKTYQPDVADAAMIAVWARLHLDRIKELELDAEQARLADRERRHGSPIHEVAA